MRPSIRRAYAAVLRLVQLVLQERCTHVGPLELVLEERDEALEDHDLSCGIEARYAERAEARGARVHQLRALEPGLLREAVEPYP